jgi:hypothetical protein
MRNSELREEDKYQKAEDGGRKAEGRKQMAENGRLMTDDGRWMTEDGRQKRVRIWGLVLISAIKNLLNCKHFLVISQSPQPPAHRPTPRREITKFFDFSLCTLWAL